MKAFFTAVIAAAVIAVVSAYALSYFQEQTSVAYSTEGVRL
ncbi:MAG TPA: hypothetical protein VHN11_21945 [Xanthobacteraceae bacterium]|jgi:hypothetical protein|nr:hypothetical protein [Xanthobacteraceae bacterium]